MSRILGVDMGSNSAGWALIDTTNEEIIDAGVRIFPEGVDRDNSNNAVSKNATRRMSRQIRRQLSRKKNRKLRLIKELMCYGMFPTTTNIESKLQETVLSQELKEFFQSDPYTLRAKAVEEKLSLHELGRVFYNLAQRRGYRESLKAPLDEESTLNEGKTETGTTGIDDTKRLMGDGTLGQYLNSINPHEQRRRNRYTLRSMYLDEFNRIWNTQKQFYPDILTDELQKHLGEPNKGLIFCQLDLRSQKHLRGKCTFEPAKSRISLTNPWFEAFRMFDKVNSIKNVGTAISDTQKQEFIRLSLSSKDIFKFKDFKKAIKSKEDTWNYEDDQTFPTCKTISKIVTLFGKDDFIKTLQQGDEKAIFSVLEECEKIWKIKSEANDPEWLEEYSQKTWNLSSEQAAAWISFKLKSDFGELSQKAIKNILSYLISGKIYHQAVLLGGIRNTFGSKWNNLKKEDIKTLEDTAESLSYCDEEGLGVEKIQNFLKEQYGLDEKSIQKLYHHSDDRQNVNVNPENISKKIASITNPIVRAAVFEFSSLIPKIIEKHGPIDTIRIEMARNLKQSKKQRDEEHSKNKEQAKKNNFYKKELEDNGLSLSTDNIQKIALWHECKETCPYSGEKISISDLFNNRFQVEHIIPYSICLNDSMGNKTLCRQDINLTKGNKTPFEAFGSGDDWNIMQRRAFSLLPKNKAQHFIAKEHPQMDDFVSKQLNDTRYIAKEVAVIAKTMAKNVEVGSGGTTAILRGLWGLNNILRRKTNLQNPLPNGQYVSIIDEDGFIIEENLSLVLRDQAAQKKKEELLAKKGIVVRGTVRENVFFPEKNRYDHRHHAIDAIVVACTTRSFVQRISTLSGKGVDIEQSRFSFPSPWDNLWHQAKDCIENILVSYKNKSKILSKSKRPVFNPKTGKKMVKNGKPVYSTGMSVRGQLHDKTFYGKHVGPDGNEYFHNRVAVEKIKTQDHINEIVDKGIKQLFLDRLKELGVDTTNEKYEVPTGENVFFTIKDKKTISMIFLPNKNGNPVPVKKVRIKAVRNNTIQPNKNFNLHVESGNNHHVAIYEDMREKFQEEVVPFWKVVERKRKGENVYQLPEGGKEIYTILQKNRLYLLGTGKDAIDWKNPDVDVLSEKLYKCQGISKADYKFTHHLASTQKFSSQLKRIRSQNSLLKLGIVEVKIDRLGKLSPVEQGVLKT